MATDVQDRPAAPASTALSVPEQKKQGLQQWIQKAEKQIRLALPKHMTPERIMRIAMSGLSRNPLLLECTPLSIVGCVIAASEAGLELNGYEGHMVPYRNNSKGTYEAQFIPDYKGLIKLMYQSGIVQSVDADCVYERDEFSYERGTNEFLRHVPIDDENRGERKYAWACAKFKGGGTKLIVLNRSQIEAHRKMSQTGRNNKGPWADHTEAMWIKTAIRVLSKFVPRSSELNAAITLDEQADRGQRQGMDPAMYDALGMGDARTLGSRSDQLADALAGNGHGLPDDRFQVGDNEDAEPADRSQVNELAKYAETLGCPESECLDHAEYAATQKAPEEYLQQKPWAKRQRH